MKNRQKTGIKIGITQRNDVEMPKIAEYLKCQQYNLLIIGKTF